MLDTLALDLRIAVRMLSHSKVLAAVAVSTLALGIGANTAIFSGVYAYLWTPLPYPQPGNLLWLGQNRGAKTILQGSVSYLDIEDWKNAGSLEVVGLFRAGLMKLGGESHYVNTVTATAEVLNVLGAQPARGRVFTASEAAAGQRVTVLTDAFWQRQFGSNPKLIGGGIFLDGQEFTVIGILRPEFTFLYQDVDAFVPLSAPASKQNRRSDRRYSAIGRLGRGAALAQAQGEIKSIAAKLEQDYPDTNRGWSPQVTTLEENLIPRDSRAGAVTALVAVALVLMIACANIANLLLSRGVLRRRELAIRVALGATRGDLRRLLLCDSMLLAAGGAVLGILIAYAGIPILKSVTPPGTPRLQSMQLNYTALLYTGCLSLTAGLVAGIMPSWFLSGSNPSTALGASGRGNVGGQQRILQGMVVAQMVFVIILLAATGLLIRSLVFQLNASPGFDKSNLLVARIVLPENEYSSPVRAADFFRQLLDSLATQRQVQSAAAADSLPVGRAGQLIRLAVEGRRSADQRDPPVACRVSITPGFFRTLGIPMVSGRDVDDRDRFNQPRVAVIDETMARRCWSDAENAIGHRFKVDEAGGGDWTTVVGVSKDVRPEGVDLATLPHFFAPHAQSPSLGMTFVARASTDPRRLAESLRAVVENLNRHVQLYQVEALDDLLTRRMAASAAMVKILGFLAGAGLCLAAMGVYGLVAYVTAERMREFGVRMALGAPRSDIFRLVLHGSWRLALLAVGIGLPLAYAAVPLLRNLLVGVRPHDWLTLLLVPAVLLAAATLASGVPAWRATRIDPAASLRVE